jgi:GNAT superfamily N-acetyltransferase
VRGHRTRAALGGRLRAPAARRRPRGAAEVETLRRTLHGLDPVVWTVGSSATPADLPARLRALGLREPDPPMDPVCAAMVLERDPPPVPGVVVRRIETLEHHLLGLEIMLSAATWSPTAAAAERARAEETFRRRMLRGGFQWLAWLDDAPVAYAAADLAAAGFFLAGGSTLPAARGRGCYRALVRARWEEAVRLGRSGLAVQAQHGSSAPILRALGFVEVATVHTLQS